MADLATITITSTDPPITVIGELDEAPPTQTGGIAVWADLERTRRKNAIDCTGSTLQRREIAVLFNGYETGTSVEAQCIALERLSRVADGDYRSPIVQIGGALPATDVKDWVIEGTNWVADTMERDEASGERIRQSVVLSVVEYAPVDVAVFAQSSLSATAAKPSNFRKVRVNRTDTLATIAKKELKDAHRWREIKNANPGKGLRGTPIPRALVGKLINVPRR